MSFYKQTKDQVMKLWLGKASVPAGLAELQYYFRMNDPIHFESEKQPDGSFVVMSTNFREGKIITRLDRLEQLDEKVTDAILTAFEVPSSYAEQASIHRVGEKGYAFA